MSDSLSVELFYEASDERSTLRFTTAGSVDDGKSTLIGRLLYDSQSIFEDTLASVRKSTKKQQFSEGVDFSLLVDGLKAEREQKITIDVAYRYFRTPRRRFILMDTPGHEQYTRNMVTGASSADAAIVLVDARKGIVEQTKRHTFILSLLRVPNIILAINKIDLINYNSMEFLKIAKDYRKFSTKLGFDSLHIMPISALRGDNINSSSEKTKWYHGPPLLEYMENLYIDGNRNLTDLRLPIQGVLRPDQDYRGYIGQVMSGVLRVGDEILVIPSQQKAKVKGITNFTKKMTKVFTPMSTTFCLDREIDISRGDMICSPNNMPQQSDQIDAMLIWMNEKALEINRTYIIKHTTLTTRVQIKKLLYLVDINTLHKKSANTQNLNEIARVSIHCQRHLHFDSYKRNRGTGSFILIDPKTNQTVAAGLIHDRISHDDWVKAASPETLAQMRNIKKSYSHITNLDREKFYGHPAKTIWLTGLSGSGKSTIARELEKNLFLKKYAIFTLDGDNLRLALNRDLGFSKSHRQENTRRIAEVAKIFNQAGITVIVALVSPYRDDRMMAKEIIGSDRFIEIFVDAPLEVCEQRDPKGLYKKARSQEIDQFTGVCDPYEIPLNCDLQIYTSEWSIEKSVDIIIAAFFSQENT